MPHSLQRTAFPVAASKCDACPLMHTLTMGCSRSTVCPASVGGPSGASRFGEELVHAGWTYDKRDGLLDFDAFDFRLAELPVEDDAFDVVETVEAFSGLKIDVRKFPFLHATTAPRIAIMRHVRLRP